MIALVAAALAGSWELAGLYDASALPRATGAAPASEWLWKAPAGMVASCGEPKSPDGLGVIEAQAVVDGLTPTLAVLLRGAKDAPPLDTRNVRMAIGKVALAPMVRPSFTTIAIRGDGLATHKQMIRTQIAMEACLEHKTGRRWQGGDWNGLRQAFLLDKPTSEEPADRMYYRGQRKPVSALLGPPDACFDASDASPAADTRTSAVATAVSLELVPSDVWGASLRDCGQEEFPGNIYDDAPTTMPLTAGNGAISAQAMPSVWRPLEVTLHGSSDEDATIDVAVGGQPIAVGLPLFGNTVDPKTGEVKKGLQDVLAMVPARFPTFEDDERQYTVLLVPSWQIVEAAAQLGGATRGSGPIDGVGWLLEHPHELTVQVAADPSVLSTPGAEDLQLPDLMSKYDAFAGRWLRWGYTVGVYAGRTEVVMASPSPPTWAETELAQRARHSSTFLAGSAILGVLLLLGVRRLPDLWARVPEERVNYWPGAAEPAAGDGPPPATPLGDMAAGE